MTEKGAAEMFPVGDYVRDEIDAREWDHKTAAMWMDLTEPRLTQILAGAVPTASEWFGIGRGFGTSSLLWMSLSEAYLLWSEHKAGRND